MSKPADEHNDLPQAEPVQPSMDHLGDESGSGICPKPFAGYLKSQKHPAGMVRHRGVVAGCGALAIAIMGLGSMDLKSLVESKATLDSNLRVSLTPLPAQLPANFRYDSNSTAEGLSAVVESSWLVSKKGFVDATGKTVIPPTFDDVRAFSGGLASVKDAKAQAWGVIDKTGKYVIPPQFELAPQFRNGVAAVSLHQNGKGALIDSSGKFVYLSPNRKRPSELAPGIFAVSGPKGGTGMMGKDGKWIVGPQFGVVERVRDNSADWWNPSFAQRAPDPNDDRFFKIRKSGRAGIIDAAGKVIIPPLFDDIVSFEKGHAAFKQDEKYGFADANGHIVIEPRFDYVTAFDDLIAVKANNRWSFIDSAGNPVAGPAIDGVTTKLGAPWLTDGLGAALFGDRFGFINAKGQVAIKPIYGWTLGFNEGFAPVWIKSRWHFIDKLGNLVGPSVGDIASFVHGHAAITVPGPLYSFINARQIEQEDNSLENRRLWLRKQGNQGEPNVYQSAVVE